MPGQTLSGLLVIGAVGLVRSKLVRKSCSLCANWCH